jgi:Lrp/AsnC family transcriptional regulator for asnA, asnC and gidA
LCHEPLPAAPVAGQIQEELRVKSAPYEQLDATDRTIVDFLREDGRMPYREIARRLGVSESMVRKRVNRLLEQGWMRIQAISDPLQLGVPILATTYLHVSPRAVEQVTDSIARCEAVRYVALGVGAHNVVVESLHADNAELHEFIQRELGLEGIISGETIQVVKIKKSVWDWEIPATYNSKPLS